VRESISPKGAGVFPLGNSIIRVREARLPDDEPAILSFINRLQDYEAAFEPARRRDRDFAVEHWRELQHRCAEKHGIMLIAEDEGKPAGWAFACDQNAELFVIEPERRHGYLAEIFVAQQARGKGLGRALIEGCESWARSRGHRLLTIAVLAKNLRAVRAYEGAGYSPYGITVRKYL
jgi:GNAT superfamily N-acetyltransferase